MPVIASCNARTESPQSLGFMYGMPLYGPDGQTFTAEPNTLGPNPKPPLAIPPPTEPTGAPIATGAELEEEAVVDLSTCVEVERASDTVEVPAAAVRSVEEVEVVAER